MYRGSFSPFEIVNNFAFAQIYGVSRMYLAFVKLCSQHCKFPVSAFMCYLQASIPFHNHFFIFSHAEVKPFEIHLFAVLLL